MKKNEIFKTQLGLLLVVMLFTNNIYGQEKPKMNDTNTSFHLLMKPQYPVPYGKVTTQEITDVLLRVYNYLESATPFRIINSKNGEVISDYSVSNSNAIFEPGDFRLISYEWGVTYAGMLLAGEITGDQRFSKYTTDGYNF